VNRIFARLVMRNTDASLRQLAFNLQQRNSDQHTHQGKGLLAPLGF
jgi:hypothetical protein